MSDKSVAERAKSSLPSAEVFRFSPRPNQAHRIHWRSWCHESFEEAARLDKPVLLLITASWSEWCHLMDEYTFSEPNIITVINSDYIPIRVDSDRRPDINQRYNQNGWPSVALLSCEGEVLWGGIYVPPQQMLYYLGYVRRYYSEHRQEIAEQVRNLQDSRFTRSLSQQLLSKEPSLLTEEEIALSNVPAEACSVLCDLFDVDYGGFSIHPHLKFPHPEALELLLLAESDQDRALEMVCFSLEQMRNGGLWDSEEGGFFRYSATNDWSAPRTEKMLEENAALLHLVVLVALRTQSIEWFELARRLICYVNTNLWQSETCVFSGSQSADQDYYDPGPYSRASRLAPYVDPTIYTSWNARMISSYLLASRVLGNPSLEEQAVQALNWLCTHMFHAAGGLYHYACSDGAGLPGQLADQVWMARALLDAYELRGDKHHLELAIDLMHYACEELLDPHVGLFYDYCEDPHAIGRLRIREHPLTENAIAAECLLRMASFSKRRHLAETALIVLSRSLQHYRHTGIQGASYAWVIARAMRNKWL